MGFERKSCFGEKCGIESTAENLVLKGGLFIYSVTGCQYEF